MATTDEILWSPSAIRALPGRSGSRQRDRDLGTIAAIAGRLPA